MDTQKIIIAGGSGYLGLVLANHFVQKNWEVVILSRKPSQTKDKIQYELWDGETLGNWQKTLEGATALVNLAGRTVNCRYNEKNKKEIYDSRLKSTQIIGKAILNCKNPPKVWLNSSSATIYRHALDRPMDEETGEIGKGFSVDVCQKWEATFHQCDTPQTRKIALRLAMVFGNNGGVMKPFLNLVKWGLGGTQGRGNQFVSWIHEVDFVRVIDWLIEKEELSGVFNVSAPNPIPNQAFLKTLRQICKQPIGLPATRWMLEIGAWCMGTETELILKSRRVVPQKLLDAGFKFQFTYMKDALEDIVKGRIPS
jgi:uncharacterized protein